MATPSAPERETRPGSQPRVDPDGDVPDAPSDPQVEPDVDPTGPLNPG